MKSFQNIKFSFLFYDYETFGIHPSIDKPAQFACIRTDLNLNVIGKYICLYCYPPNDYLPNPNSVLVTGITPQYTRKNGINEFFFSKKIFSILNVPNTCIIGYNNINFDDEFTRNIFYRNLLDPYSWSWKNNNSRFDVINIIRVCYVLSPTGIVWPKNLLGVPSFKLIDLTRANHLLHNSAHDALSDVQATISLMKLIKLKKPKIFNFFLKYRFKNSIKNLINIYNMEPLIYISNIFGITRKYMTSIVPLMWNKNNQNMLIFFDLYMDVDILINSLKNQCFSTVDFQYFFKLGINFLYINKCPSIIPIFMFRKKKLSILQIDIKKIRYKISILKKNIFLIQKYIVFFETKIYKNTNDNVDLKIYDGFFNNYDKKLMNSIHKISIHKFKSLNVNFFDSRLKDIFLRCYYRNFNHFLNIEERQNWNLYRSNIFNKQYLNEYIQNVKYLFSICCNDFKKRYLLHKLLKYVNVVLK